MKNACLKTGLAAAYLVGTIACWSSLSDQAAGPPSGGSGTMGAGPTMAELPGASTPPNGPANQGTSSTAWAQNCPQGSTYSCVPGTWKVKDPVNPAMPPTRFQSEHFALRWNGSLISDQQANAAGATLERIWVNHMQAVGFIEPYCKETEKFKVNVHLDPSFGLSGSGTGDKDPAFWIPPGSLADVWGLAHEFAHALQFASQGLRDSPYSGWFWENHANFMAHTMVDYKDSDVHCTELSVDFPHLYLGSTRNRYCVWQFLDYYKDRFCMQAVNEIWTAGKRSGDPLALQEDPFSIMAQTRNWSHDQLNDFFGEWMLHNITWDYRDPDGTDQGAKYRKAYGPATDVEGGPEGWRHSRVTRLDALAGKKEAFAVPFAQAPQRYGYNLVRLTLKDKAPAVDVTFHGNVQDAAATTEFGPYRNTPSTLTSPASDWRWGVVAVDASGTKARYSPLQRGPTQTLHFAVNAEDDSLWLMVMATPSKQQQIIWDQMYYTIYRYPWWVELAGASTEPLHPAAAAKKGGTVWDNGGGWVATGANVAAGAFVGPQAVVLGGTVAAGARIEDRAIILDADIRDQAVVGGISVLAGGIVVGGNAQIRTVFQPPGTYEPEQTVAGTGMLLGDVELRGRKTQVNGGVFYGMVDDEAARDPKQGSARTQPMAEVTRAPVFP